MWVVGPRARVAGGGALAMHRDQRDVSLGEVGGQAGAVVDLGREVVARRAQERAGVAGQTLGELLEVDVGAGETQASRL